MRIMTIMRKMRSMRVVMMIIMVRSLDHDNHSLEKAKYPQSGASSYGFGMRIVQIMIKHGNHDNLGNYDNTGNYDKHDNIHNDDSADDYGLNAEMRVMIIM